MGQSASGDEGIYMDIVWGGDQYIHWYTSNCMYKVVLVSPFRVSCSSSLAPCSTPSVSVASIYIRTLHVHNQMWAH